CSTLHLCLASSSCSFFFFSHGLHPVLYSFSLHDALPISCMRPGCVLAYANPVCSVIGSASMSARSATQGLFVSPIHATVAVGALDRKSTRLNSSHQIISYAVFCLKKKKLTYITKTSC